MAQSDRDVPLTSLPDWLTQGQEVPLASFMTHYGPDPLAEEAARRLRQTGQNLWNTYTAPIRAAKSLTEKAATGTLFNPLTDDPSEAKETAGEAFDVVGGIAGARMPFAKAGELGAAGGKLPAAAPNILPRNLGPARPNRPINPQTLAEMRELQQSLPAPPVTRPINEQTLAEMREGLGTAGGRSIIPRMTKAEPVYHATRDAAAIEASGGILRHPDNPDIPVWVSTSPEYTQHFGGDASIPMVYNEQGTAKEINLTHFNHDDKLTAEQFADELKKQGARLPRNLIGELGDRYYDKYGGGEGAEIFQYLNDPDVANELRGWGIHAVRINEHAPGGIAETLAILDSSKVKPKIAPPGRPTIIDEPEEEWPEDWEQEPLLRDIIARGRSGRPIKTAPFPIGSKNAILEASGQRLQQSLPAPPVTRPVHPDVLQAMQEERGRGNIAPVRPAPPRSADRYGAALGTMGEKPNQLYHVAGPDYRAGQPIQSLYGRLGNNAYDAFAERWPEAGDLGQEHAHKIFFYDNLAEAKQHVEDFGGSILNVDPSKVEGLVRDKLEIPFGKKHGYWVTDQDVPAEALSSFGKTNSAPAGIGPASEPTPQIQAYHGSPHDFDRFDLSKIGTGEGAQAYGHGLYFAESEGTAQHYRDALVTRRDPTYRVGDEEMTVGQLSRRIAGRLSVNDYAPRAVLRDLAAGLSFDDIRKGNPPSFGKVIDWVENNNVKHVPDESPAGRMYEVSIKADPEHFLDWDKPLSEQSETVQKALKNIPNIANSRTGNPTGQEIHNLADLASRDQSGGEALRAAGIPGIKYLDQGSRAGGDGTRNYVVFDDRLIDILKKYGLAGLAALPALNAMQSRPVPLTSLPAQQ